MLNYISSLYVIVGKVKESILYNFDKTRLSTFVLRTSTKGVRNV